LTIERAAREIRPMRRLTLALLVVLPVASLAAASLLGAGRVGDRDPAGRFSTSGKPAAVVGEPVGSLFVPDATLLGDCSAGPVGARCREQALGNLATAEGPAVAMARLRTGIADGTIPPDECHMATHKIGSGAMRYFEGDIASVVAASIPDCTEGYLHGALEPLFIDVGPADRSGISGRMADSCGSARSWKLAFVQQNCFHAAAHAAMLRSGYNLPLVIDACRDSTSGEPPDLFPSCLQGAFMENFIPSYAVRSPWLDDDDLVFPCPTFADRNVARACWIQLGDRLALLPGLSLETFAQLCTRAPGTMRQICIQGLGRTIAHRSIGAPPRGPVDDCSIAAPVDGEAACLWQFALSSMNENRGVATSPLSQRVGASCRLVAAGPSREACWQGLGYGLYQDGGAEGAARDEQGRIIPPFDPSERCAREGIGPGEALEWCARGASGRIPSFLDF
jgi:hypothetical protein